MAPSKTCGWSSREQPHAWRKRRTDSVRAAGIDPGIWHLMTGRPYMMRLMGMGFTGPKAPVARLDAAGSRRGRRAEVTPLQAGDAVSAIGDALGRAPSPTTRVCRAPLLPQA